MKGRILTVEVNGTEYMKIPTSDIENEISREKSKNILIAEDEEFNRLFLAELLIETKSNLIWAMDGLEALEHFNNFNIDLILMDIKMPRMGGLEATRQIRSINDNIPIIAQTAFAMEDEEMKFRSQGFSDYIKKPINITEFYEKIDYWLNTYQYKSNSTAV
jgi:two-component system cell cycle response regulator DivK